METKNFDDLDKYIIPFGKYEGEYLGDVVVEDRQYIKWVSETMVNEFGSKAREILML
jgi:uncharacterized protein (DUF3820 family)